MRIKIYISACVLLLVLFTSCEKDPEGFDWEKYEQNDTTSNTNTGVIKDMQKVFSFAPQNRYAYCPSIIEEGDIQHVYFCGTPTENVFIDHVYYMTIDREGHATTPKSVLQPTNVDGHWDDQHTCDPSVVAGNFGYKGTDYKYAMFYLGCTKEFYYNEIGVAFANSLDANSWVKYDTVLLKKPWSAKGDQLIGDFKAWGIGQPDAITLNPENGDVLLSYTRGDNTGTRAVFRLISNMKDMENIEIGPEKTFPTSGLLKYHDNTQDYISNVAIARDEENNQIVMFRKMDPLSNIYPAFIHSYLELTRIDEDDFFNSTGTWSPIAEISPSDTKYPRNHNQGLVRDQYGNTVCAPDTMEVYFTTSLEEPSVSPSFGNFAEWTYTIWRAKLNPL